MPRVVEEWETEGVIEQQKRMRDYYILRIRLPATDSKKMQHLIGKKVKVTIKVIEE